MSDMSALRRASTIYDGSYPPEVYEPNPRITTLTPSTVSAAAGPTTVTVTGQNFTDQSVVEINQVAQTTTFVSETSLTVSYDPTVAGPVTFTVRDGQGESNSVPFNVTALAAADVEAWTVDQVKGFVLENPDLRPTVAAIERDGKARSTLLAWLDEGDEGEAETPEPRPAPEAEPETYHLTEAERETGGPAI